MHQRSDVPSIAQTCFALFIGSVLLMPALDGRYDPIDQTISEGVLARYGLVQVVGMLALAAGSFALAYSLRALRPRAMLLPTIALVSFSAMCVVAVAVFPTDADGDRQSWVGQAHNTAATLAFISNIAAMFWSVRVFRLEPRLSSLAGMSLAVGMIALALLAMLRLDAEPRGLVQRAAVSCILFWMIGVTFRLRVVESEFVTQKQ